ncbi:MAG: hypothetical protein M1819_004270 [Sarea resinae]|nr:MAG: hypothetical protein M1819_004270 [Sarea resinae]
MAPHKESVRLTWTKAGTQPPVYVSASFTSPPWEAYEMEHTLLPSEKSEGADQSEQAAYEFSKVFEVEEGEWQYKFRMGLGDWWVCDENGHKAIDEHGNENNILVVGKGKTTETTKAPVPESSSTEPSDATSPTKPIHTETAPEATESLPKNKAPNTSEVETKEPQKADSSAKELEVSKPEAEKPSIKELETKKPEVEEPEAKSSKAKESETKVQEVKEPGIEEENKIVKEPQVTEPDIKKAEVEAPETKVAEAEVNEPGVQEAKPTLKAPEIPEPEAKSTINTGEETKPVAEEPENKIHEIKEPEVRTTEPVVEEVKSLVKDSEIKEPELPVSQPKEDEETSIPAPEVTDSKSSKPAENGVEEPEEKAKSESEIPEPVKSLNEEPKGPVTQVAEVVETKLPENGENEKQQLFETKEIQEPDIFKAEVAKPSENSPQTLEGDSVESGQPKAESHGKDEISHEVPVPFTVVDKAQDQEQPVYGNVEPSKLSEEDTKREADAHADVTNESPGLPSETDTLGKTAEQQAPTPAVVVEKVNAEPSHGDDFGPSATHGQKEAHEQRALDAKPDKVLIEPEPASANEPANLTATAPVDDPSSSVSESAATAAEVADSAAELHDSLDERKIGTTDVTSRRLSSTPIPEVANTAAEVADIAAGLGDTLEEKETSVEKTSGTAIPEEASDAPKAVSSLEGAAEGEDRPLSSTPIPEAAAVAAEVADTAADLAGPSEGEKAKDVQREGEHSATSTHAEADTAAEVADSAATLDDDKLAPQSADINRSSASSPGLDQGQTDSPAEEPTPLFAHECMTPDHGGLKESPTKPEDNLGLKEQSSDDIEDPSLETFPSDRAEILDRIRATENRLGEDETTGEVGLTSPSANANGHAEDQSLKTGPSSISAGRSPALDSIAEEDAAATAPPLELPESSSNEPFTAVHDAEPNTGETAADQPESESTPAQVSDQAPAEPEGKPVEAENKDEVIAHLRATEIPEEATTEVGSEASPEAELPTTDNIIDKPVGGDGASDVQPHRASRPSLPKLPTKIVNGTGLPPIPSPYEHYRPTEVDPENEAKEVPAEEAKEVPSVETNDAEAEGAPAKETEGVPAEEKKGTPEAETKIAAAEAVEVPAKKAESTLAEEVTEVPTKDQKEVPTADSKTAPAEAEEVSVNESKEATIEEPKEVPETEAESAPTKTEDIPPEVPLEEPKDVSTKETEAAPVEETKAFPAEEAKEAPAEEAREVVTNKPETIPAEEPQTTPAKEAEEVPAEEAEEVPVEELKPAPAEKAATEEPEELLVEEHEAAPVHEVKETPVEKDVAAEKPEDISENKTKEATAPEGAPTEETQEVPVEEAKEAPAVVKEAPIDEVPAEVSGESPPADATEAPADESKDVPVAETEDASAIDEPPEGQARRGSRGSRPSLPKLPTKIVKGIGLPPIPSPYEHWKPTELPPGTPAHDVSAGAEDASKREETQAALAAPVEEPSTIVKNVEAPAEQVEAKDFSAIPDAASVSHAVPEQAVEEESPAAVTASETGSKPEQVEQDEGPATEDVAEEPDTAHNQVEPDRESVAGPSEEDASPITEEEREASSQPTEAPHGESNTGLRQRNGASHAEAPATGSQSVSKEGKHENYFQYIWRTLFVGWFGGFIAKLVGRKKRA